MHVQEPIQISTEIQQLVLPEIAHRYGLIPVRLSEQCLHCLVADSKKDVLQIDELEMILGHSIQVEPVDDSLVQQALTTYYRLGRKTEQQSSLKLTDDFLENLIHDAKATESSDIHFEIYKDKGRVRCRIDGKLITRYSIKTDQYAELINKIKIKARLNITERRLPQDGRIQYEDFDIRVSVLPTLYGEKVVMRLLGKDTAHLTMDALGMEAEDQQDYLHAAKASKGIILISGPTGSGKTTTLYATLKLLNREDNNIVTIEDPIEYTLEGINQVQLKEDIGLDFTAALKSFLRQDPDVIMLGEIRDAKTAQMAIRASLTGHLVLSTIHTNSALGTLSRLMDMGVPPFLIAETLNISVAQRLLRKLCPDCKKEEQAAPASFKNSKLASLKSHWVPQGCPSCYNTGYKGRIAVYECIPIDSRIKQLIQSEDAAVLEDPKVLDYSRLSDKAMALVLNGTTSVEEAYALLND
ncbi:GspE/PulE family protein [Gilvibacter sp.]|uniref:GspE/PulE family protein n=1 Tax=Gilvibacter sp. TaxID=2729997 RepID=UPI003F49F23F